MQLNSEPKIDLHKQSQLILIKGAKAFQWRKSFQQVMLDQLDIYIPKKKKKKNEWPRLHTFHKKVNLKLIMDLNIKNL